MTIISEDAGILIECIGGELFVDSRLIADRLGIEHESFLETLDAHRVKAEAAFGVFRAETGKPQKGSRGGRPQNFFFLNEDQATFLMTLSRNTPQVVDAKISVVKSFSMARKLLKDKADPQPSITPEHVEAYQFDRDTFTPWALDNPTASTILLGWKSPALAQALPPDPVQRLEARSIEPAIVLPDERLIDLIDNLSLAANRAGLAGNKSIKEAEFLDQRFARLRSEILQLEAENDRLKLDASDRADLETQISRLETLVAEQESQILQKSVEVQENDLRIQVLEKRIKSLDKSLLKKENTQLKSSIEKWKKEERSLLVQIEILERELGKYRSKCAACTHAVPVQATICPVKPMFQLPGR